MKESTGPRKRRRSIRLRGFDYGQEGAYFVTICTANRKAYFGSIVNNQVALSPFGNIAKIEWTRTASLRSNVILDEFVVMPDHVHGIVCITENRNHLISTEFTTTAQTLGSVVRGWKSAVTKKVRLLQGDPTFKLWQRGYWEHVVRNERDLEELREYIRMNPLQWRLKQEALREEMVLRS
ncbi:MAG: transposase [candidate division Zixibacteria bacterium]|nr:transposase [candidate division Zixibacteria bacterium]